MKRVLAVLMGLGVLLIGCAQPPQEVAQAPAATTIVNLPTTLSSSASASTAPTATSVLPTATLHLPTVTPIPPTAPPPPPTATPPPPTATPDPFAPYNQFTIAQLRSRSYGTGAIEIVRVLEEAPQFTRYLVAYGSDGLRITAMLNQPRGDGPFPAVLLNHGYYPLDVYQTGNGTQLAADYLAARGFVTLSPDFRGHAGSTAAPNQFRAGHVIDTLNAIPLLQRWPHVQAGKIGMWGHSNGGAITAKAITISDQIGAALIYAPASSNIVEDYQFRMERAAARGQHIEAADWPVKPDQAPDLYTRLSPLPYMRYVSAPVQIHWGTADETVPRKWSEDLRNALQAANKPVEWFEYPGQPHSFQGAGNAVYLERMVEFFTRTLRP